MEFSEVAGVPSVDVAGLVDAQSADHPAVRQLRQACCETGFFIAAGHSVPTTVVDRALDASQRFFALTEVEKRKCIGSEANGWRGYGPYGSSQNCSAASKRPDKKETFYWGSPGKDLDPAEPVEGFEASLRDFHNAMLELSRVLLAGLSLSLGLPKDHFERMAFSNPVAKVLLASYAPATEGELSCGAHTDCGFLTLVCQEGSNGLEVQQRDGVWLQCKCDRYSFVANLGDLAQRWTNDVYRSSPHQVVNNSGAVRRSLVFFNNLDKDALVECLSSCTSADRPAKYSATTCGAYVAARLADMRNGFESPA